MTSIRLRDILTSEIKQTQETGNPEQVNLAFTNKLLTWHFSLLEDHLLEMHREPTEQCLSCANWHLEKIKAYNTLERPKFDPQCSQESCHDVTHWADIVQSKLPNMSKEEALKYGKQAREFRYYFAGDVAELPDMHIEEHQQGDGRIRLRDLLQETPATAESQLNYLEMALATQADVFRDWETRLKKTNPECAEVAKEAKELFQEYQQEASLGIGQKEAKMGKYAGEKLRSYQSGGSREGIRLRDILQEPIQELPSEQDWPSLARSAAKELEKQVTELRQAIETKDPNRIPLIRDKLLDIAKAMGGWKLEQSQEMPPYERKLKDFEVYYCDMQRLHPHNEIVQIITTKKNPRCPYCGNIMTYGSYWKAEQSQEMPPYERKLQEAEKEALEAVRKAPEDSFKIALAIEKVAKAKDVDKDELIRRVVTEDRVELTSISPDTYRVVFEGKEIGPVLSEEEATKEGAVKFTRCIMHQFLGQPDWCIRGYEQGKYEVREGQTVEKATGKPIPGCYSPIAVCRSAVYGEYAGGGK